MDKIVAAVAGMSAALYFLASLVAWYRVASPRSESMFSGVFLDRAVAWTGLFVLFTLIASVKMKMAEWTDNVVDVFLLLALIAVYAAGMWSVRQISQRRFPLGGPAVFAAFTIVVGLLILMA